MTGSGVGRRPRTACPVPAGSPAGVSTLMPPHIQGAERRTERRAGRARWGWRALVVGGLAGAAWLLTGAAAHAADRVDGPSGPLLGSVVGGDATAPVTGLLTAAARPLESVAPAHGHHVVAAVLDVPRRVLTRPAETLSEVGHGHIGTSVDGAVRTVGQALREIGDPIRLTGGSTIARQLLSPVAPVIGSLRPVVDRTPHPTVASVHPASRAVADAAVSGTPISPAPSRADQIGSAIGRAPIGSVLPAPVLAVPASAPLRHGKTASVAFAHRHRVTVPATATEGTTGDDGPAAPLQLHLGDVSGTPTSGSGTPTGGGSPAFLPAAIADSTMACQLLPIATDVEARRYDAEAPTVSPD